MVGALSADDRILLLDGGMGQELRARSRAGHHALWSAQVLIEEPGTVQAAHEDFIRAGAELIITNTYSTIRRKLAEAGIEERFSDLNRLAAEIAVRARDAVGTPVLIAGSLPPLHGTYRPERVRSFEKIEPLYHEQAEILAPSVDLFICETMSSAAEARAAVHGASGLGKPVWVAWTLEDGGSSRLRSGETIAEAWSALDGLPVAAALVNCCWPESVGAAIPELVALDAGVPVGGYANGFQAIPEDWESLKGVDKLGSRPELGPEAYARHVADWIDGGARIVGGCCEIGPAHIARLRELISARSS